MLVIFQEAVNLLKKKNPASLKFLLKNKFPLKNKSLHPKNKVPLKNNQSSTVLKSQTKRHYKVNGMPEQIVI